MSGNRLKARTITRRQFAAGAAATAAVVSTPFARARAQAALRVGILLPTSGMQAQIGQDNLRGVEITVPILDELGYPPVQFMNGDTETNVQIARAQAEKLINDGAQILVGAFDSGQTTAIAQVAEQRGIPLVIHIAAAPDITEQGYKFVFRNFPTAPKIVGDAFRNQKELFEHTGKVPKTVVLMHVNDTFGTAMQRASMGASKAMGMPYEIVDSVSYDPRARDLSVEVARARASGAESLMVVSRLNDAMLLTREMVKQRWEPMGIFSMGPGWYEDQYMATLGRLGNDVISFVPWYDPNKPLSKRLEQAFAKSHPDRNLNTNHIFTFEAIMTAADAYKRAGSADPQALAAALRETNITNNVTIGPGIRFDAKGQNVDVTNAGIQNRDGKHVVVLPRAAAAGDVIWPMRGWQARS